MDKPEDTPDLTVLVRKLEEQNYELEKQLRAKEAVAKKDKAVYEQKIQLLELQIRESKEREENVKKLHNTMLSVLNEPGNSTNIPKELELASSLHKKEIEDLKEHHKIIVESLERQIASSKAQANELERKVKELQDDKESLENCFQEKENELKTKLKDAEDRLKVADEDKKKLKEAMELDAQVKIVNLNEEMEKMKAEHAKELEQMKQKCETSLDDIKYIYQQEKITLERRLEKAQTEIKLLQSQKDRSCSESQIQELQANYFEEIQELNTHLEEFKKQAHDEVLALTVEKDEAVLKVKNLEAELVKSKESYNAVQANYQRIKSTAESAEGTQGELKKYKKQVSEMKAHITKLEGNERRLKVLLANKEAAFEAEKEALKRKFGIEQKKAVQAHEGYIRVKDECDKKLTQVLQDVIAKDQQITTLSKQLETALKEDKKTRTPESAAKSGPKEFEDSKEITQYKLVVANANRVECKKCGNLIDASEFTEHLARGCEVFTERVGTEGVSALMSQSIKSRTKFFPSETVSGKPQTAAMKKLKMTEELLKEMAFKLDVVQQQRDKVQIELDKANAELLSMRIRFPEHSAAKYKTQVKENVEKMESESSIKKRQIRSVSTVNGNFLGTPAGQKNSGKKQPICRNSNCGATMAFQERKNGAGKMGRKMCFSPGSASKRGSRAAEVDEDDAVVLSPGDERRQMPRASVQHVTKF